MSERYYREECGCVEIVDVDARSVSHVPCPAHKEADTGAMMAESCPACDDDGKPCALCNQAFSQPVEIAQQNEPNDEQNELADFYERIIARLSGGQQSVTLEQVEAAMRRVARQEWSFDKECIEETMKELRRVVASGLSGRSPTHG